VDMRWSDLEVDIGVERSVVGAGVGPRCSGLKILLSRHRTNQGAFWFTFGNDNPCGRLRRLAGGLVHGVTSSKPTRHAGHPASTTAVRVVGQREPKGRWLHFWS
jgi:hypothetical protein